MIPPHYQKRGLHRLGTETKNLGKAERESSAPPSRKSTQPRVNRKQEPWIVYCVLGYVLVFVGDQMSRMWGKKKNANSPSVIIAKIICSFKGSYSAYSKLA